MGRWFQKAFKCDNFAKRCDKNNPEMFIPQCACQLVWARGTKDSNKFCQRLSEIEKDNLISLTTAAMKNKLEILPQNRKARIMMIKSLYKAIKSLRTLVNAPPEAEDLLNIKDELVYGFNNITRNFSSSDDIGGLFSIITGLEAINSNDIAEITSLINSVMGYFKMGKSCDFSGEIGTFPFRDEFCNSTLGTVYMKNAMTCPIHQETHEMYANMFFELLSPSNYTNWMEDYENSDQYDRQGRKMGEKSKQAKDKKLGKDYYRKKGPIGMDQDMEYDYDMMEIDTKPF